MLSVPTLFTVLVVDFLAVGLIWAYVMRSYPKFDAARFWALASFSCAAGAGISMTRGFVAPLFPVVVGNGLMVSACCFAELGLRRFYGKEITWWPTVVIVASSCAALGLFLVVFDDMAVRIVAYSAAQSIPIAATLPLVLRRIDGRINPGAWFTGIIGSLFVAVHAVRSACAMLQIGGALSITGFNGLQAAMMLFLLFLAMAWNFGFLLMAIDRLRNEVADLALLDDLTGVANRRHLAQRLAEECARSERSGEPFALLVIDLDGFKTVNDTHGHAAGDACLQHFTLMAQTRLRPGDLLARSGGDEFCVVLPSSTLREGAMIAGRVLEVCRADAEGCMGADIPIAVSIGVAQWDRSVGPFPERLTAAADHALYAAKRDGRNRYAAYDPSPPLLPEGETAMEVAALNGHV